MPTDTKTIELAGRTIARLGLGSNRLTDTPENRDFLTGAVAAGLGHIDTAHLYTDGASETTIGGTFPGEVADRPLIATKGGYRSNDPEQLRAELEQSFERLQTGFIDLYYLHRVNSEAPLEATIELLAGYVEAGRIGHLGLSEVSTDQIRTARKVIEIAAVQNEYSLDERKHEEVIDFCEAEGLVFVPFFPLRGEPEQLAEVAAAHDATPNQVRIAWLLQRSPCVLPIPGTLSLDHLRENLAALEIELGEDELRSL